ncbi:MAG: tryptophan--tRNA ligase, partial [Selenomonadaceae bacterium]|nr:tryptophan--tRNA ligase [Selenomonadaceae bacterium]
VSDPGHIEGNVVFTYLDAFCEDKKTVAEMKEHYQRGGLGDVKVKKFLLEVLEKILTPIRQRRAEYENNPAEVMKILKAGTEAANEKANEVLRRVKSAMKINYFD